MSPGPRKQFSPEQAVLDARDLFWRDGHDGTGIRALEEALGIGRKSLYDTFGSKRELYRRALDAYAGSVLEQMAEGLARPGTSAWQNLRRVLRKLADHHGSRTSHGCLLGVAMGQVERGDEELAAQLRGHLRRLEQAFLTNLRQAQADGDVRADLDPGDGARQLVALVQGMALLGRIATGPGHHRSILRATLATYAAGPMGAPS